jgi:carbohydrate diacid regulator
MMTEHFERVAGLVAQRAAELLSTRVSVVDEHGALVAGSAPQPTECPSMLTGHDLRAESLRVPVHLDGQEVEVVVTEPTGGESISRRLAEGLVELVVSQTSVVDRLPNQHELKNKFIHDLLRGAIADEEAVRREGQILGMDFSRPRAVILIDAADYILSTDGSAELRGPDAWIRRSALRARLVIASIVRFFELPDDTICAYIGEGEVAVLKASSTQDLVAWSAGADGFGDLDPSWANLTALKRAGAALLSRLRRDTNAAISVGIGRYHPGIRGLPRSYQDARAALALGRRFHGQNQVHCLDGLGIAAFVGVSDERTKIELSTHLLSPLDQDPELLETLDAFFYENCSPSQTASRLSIHRNTLGYRLDKITSLTGLDPRRFDDAVQIRLALVLRSLRAEPERPGKCPRLDRLSPPNVGQTPDEFARVNRSA